MATKKLGELVETPAATTHAAAGLVTLAELVAEGLAASVDALTARLDGEVVLDDIGRRCCTREMARELLAQRERQRVEQREAQAAKRRRLAEQDPVAAQRRRGIGVPVPDGVDPGISAVALMVEPEREAGRGRKRGYLDEMLYGNDLTYHPVSERES